MDVLSTLATVLTLLAIPGIAVVAGRLFRTDGESSRAGLFRETWDPGWPRGVQEDEPTRYKVELIGQAAFAATPRSPRGEATARLARLERELGARAH